MLHGGGLEAQWTGHSKGLQRVMSRPRLKERVVKAGEKVDLREAWEVTFAGLSDPWDA